MSIPVYGTGQNTPVTPGPGTQMQVVESPVFTAALIGTLSEAYKLLSDAGCSSSVLYGLEEVLLERVQSLQTPKDAD